tara:strand:+ start:675 stop:1283 length:609 start_codon:yes stop_codon:yes gene_type:complete
MTEKKNLYKLFPEPVFQYKLNDYKKHNKNLQKYIYDLYEKDTEGVQRSNVDGWHSKSFRIVDKESPAYSFFQETKKYIIDVFKVYGWKYDPSKVRMTEMWAIINKKNNLNTAHTHPNNFLSSAYYVKAPKDCGTIKFINPNSVAKERFPKLENKTEFNQNGIEINPSEGDLLIFPSYLMHAVNRNLSNDDRIVISFNIDISR